MPTYPLPTLGVTFGPNGPVAPPFTDILNSLVATAQSIYGSDIYLPPDGQDMQLLAAFATAINDANNGAIAAYNSLRPTQAVGVGLSSIVPVAGISRQPGTNSTAPCLISGVAGTVISLGIVQDTNGNLWDLPDTVTIPPGGSIGETVTSEVEGALTAPVGPVTIYTPTRGWQSASLTATPTLGASTEGDGALRERFTESTALPAQTPLSSIAAEVGQVAGVSRSKVYENQFTPPDANGIPGHTVSAVVAGGTSTDIATAIERKKSPGTGTYGTTTVVVGDPSGVPIPISFFILSQVQIFVSVITQPLDGYVASTGDSLIQAIVDFINSLDIGEDVFYNWMFGPAQLYGQAVGLTYRVTSLQIGFSSGSEGTADLAIAFNAAATSATGNIVLTVL